MAHRVFSLVMVSLLVVGACSQSGDARPDEVLTPSTSTLTTLTDTTSEPSPTTVAAAASSNGEIEVAQCKSPSASTPGQSETFHDLHSAVYAVTEHTNELGEALISVDSFDSGWEEQEPVATVIESLLEGLDLVEELSASLLIVEIGATYDEAAASWVFPESMWPISPELAQLEELATASSIYRNDILPQMFSISTQADAISHWNQGASPCGHANGMVERLESARQLFTS